MTIAVACTLADGVVFGADSAITVKGNIGEAGEGEPREPQLLKVYNDAEKLFGLHTEEEDGLPVGIVAFGLASLGTRTLRSYVREFEISNPPDELAEKNLGDVASDLHEFFREYYEEIIGSALEEQGQDIEEIPAPRLPKLGLFLGGFSPDKSLPEAWEIGIHFPVEHEQAVTRVREPGNFGSNWGGQFDGVRRFHKGYDPELINAFLDRILGTLDIDLEEGSEEAQQIEAVARETLSQFEYQVPFVAMPLQEGIDYVKFLLEMMILQNRFVVGAPTCGGPIRLGVVRKYEGFEWVTEPEFEIRRT